MDKRIIVLMSIFFLSFTLFISMIVLRGPLSRATRASGKYIIVSPSESKIIYWPQTVKADGIASSNIQVFLISENKTPIYNKKVQLKTDLGSVKEGELSKTSEGKSYYEFNLISDKSGTANLEVVIDDTLTLNQKISVKFIP